MTEEVERKVRVEQREKTGETESGHSLIIGQLQCSGFLTEVKRPCKLCDRKSLHTLMNHHYPTNENPSGVVSTCT